MRTKCWYGVNEVGYELMKFTKQKEEKKISKRNKMSK